MAKGPRFYFPFFILFFVAVIAGYAITGFMGARHGALIALTDGLPSTDHLTGARAALRTLDTAMEKALLGKIDGRPLDRKAVDEALGVLHLEWDRYCSLPISVGEPELSRPVRERLKVLDETETRLLGTLETGSVDDAIRLENGGWTVASDRLDASLHSLILLNVRLLEDFADRAIQGAERSVLILFIGTAVSITAGLIALWVANRAIRQRESDLEDRAKEWEMFSGRVAHDLVSPLQAVNIALRLATERCADGRVSNATTRGLAALGRVRQTVDTLLGFAKSGGKPDPNDRAPAGAVAMALIDELHPLAEEASIDLQSEPFPDFEVRCSPGVLNLLLSNLLRNAIKYMGNRPERRVRLNVSVGIKDARFEVQDTGPGVDPEMQKHIFQPLVRGAITQQEGIGLGLATVKRVAEAHGGEVGVRSVKGSGSVFWVRLPLATEEPSSRRNVHVDDAPELVKPG